VGEFLPGAPPVPAARYRSLSSRCRLRAASLSSSSCRTRSRSAR
jgi:hypothetical protein